MINILRKIAIVSFVLLQLVHINFNVAVADCKKLSLVAQEVVTPYPTGNPYFYEPFNNILFLADGLSNQASTAELVATMFPKKRIIKTDIHRPSDFRPIKQIEYVLLDNS